MVRRVGEARYQTEEVLYLRMYNQKVSLVVKRDIPRRPRVIPNY